MVKTLKKVTALLLALCMVFALAACGGTADTAKDNTAGTDKSTSADQAASTGETKDAGKEPTTITWLGGVFSKDITTGILDNPVFNEITKKTGITIDFTPSLGLQDADQQISVLLASGDLPDIVTSTNATLLPKILAAKAAIPLDDLVKTNAPDLAKNVPSMITVSKLTSSDETHALYILHNDAGNDGKEDIMAIDNDWVVRWDLYKKLGMPKINNYDDLLKLGEDMMKLEPTNKDGKKNYAFGAFLGESWGHLLMTKPSDNYSGNKCYHIEAGFDVANDKVTPYIQDPNNEFWKQTQAMNKAYQKGLFDPESATLKFQNFQDKAKTGRYMIGMCNWMLGGAADQFRADGQPEKGYVPLVFGEIKPNSFFTESSIEGSQWMTFITKSCEKPERAMDLINFLSTPEGIALISYGVEGTHWNPKDGYIQWTQEVLDNQKKDADYYKKIGYGLQAATFVNKHAVKDPRGFVLFENPEERMKNAPDFLQDYAKTMNVKYPAEVLQKGNLFNYWNSVYNNITLVPNSDLANSSAKINAYISTAVTKAIFQKTDEGFEKQKAEIIKQTVDMGANDIMNYYTEQYDVAKKALAEIK